MILSNNHVLANSNSAAPGDPILQPGSADGGRVDSDTIARLERFCPIQFAGDPSTCSIANFYVDAGNAIAKLLGSRHRLSAMQVNPQASNVVDAAVARPVDDSQVLEEILEIGAVAATRAAELGMTVRKSGRTTALTSGQITVLDAIVTINYGSGREATFEGQIVTSMSSGVVYRILAKVKLRPWFTLTKSFPCSPMP